VTLKNRLAFSLLWINFAAGSVVLILTAENQLWSVRELLRSLAYSLVYANVSGVLGFLIVGSIAERLSKHRVPVMPVVTIGVIVVTAMSCLLAQLLLMAMGFVAVQHFWVEYRRTLQLGIPLALVFGLGALVYGSLRERLQTAEQKLHEKEIAEERLRKLAAESRLRLLESRIHPHFLFNTLNSIMSLIVANPAQAEQVVGRLASLLRASLDTTDRPLIALREELAMVESYIEIERARFGDRLRGFVEVPDELQNTRVPPMSIQSLVENAVKHGITSMDGGGEVRVSASEEAGNVHIEVRDSGPGFELAAICAGHGLDSLVQRLDALFGAQARINVLRRNGYSVVEMILPRL